MVRLSIIGPARVVSTVDGPVAVMVGDKVIKEFGRRRDAEQFAMGYNYGWHARGHIEIE